MDRLALSLVFLGLFLILGTVGTVLGSAAPDLSRYAAAAAVIAGASIIAGLAILERRAFRLSASQPARPVRLAFPVALPLADRAA